MIQLVLLAVALLNVSEHSENGTSYHTRRKACMPKPSILIWLRVVVSFPSPDLSSNTVEELGPYLQERQSSMVRQREAVKVSNSQAKNTAPMAPSSKTPTGAEFHLSLVT